MKQHLAFTAIGLASAILCGCASYTVQPVAGTKLNGDWQSEKAAKGYVFYQPELYFLVTRGSAQNASTNKDTSSQADNKVSVTPLYLPNPEKAYRLTTFNCLAKSDFEFTFKDGWQLTSITDKGDNTTIANTLAGELATAVSTAAKIRETSAPATKTNTTFLLHPEYNEAGIITGFTTVPCPMELR
jgi:hypothetical protein